VLATLNMDQEARIFTTDMKCQEMKSSTALVGGIVQEVLVHIDASGWQDSAKDRVWMSHVRDGERGCVVLFYDATKRLLSWLVEKVQEGSQDVFVFTAIAKIYVDTNNNAETFLKENPVCFLRL
jgi:hypothetical protein